MRFTDFLRVSVLLFGGSGTVLATVAIARATAGDDRALILVAVGWWTIAAVAGLWLGRRMAPTPGIARLLAGARSTNTLPEIEPGAIIFNRLWPLAVLTVLSGAAAFLLAQVPAIAAGYAIGIAPPGASRQVVSRRSRIATALASTLTAARPSGRPS